VDAPRAAGLSRPRAPDPAQALAERTQVAFKKRRAAARRAAAASAARWTAPFALVAAVAALVYLSPVFAVRAGDIEISGLGGWIDKAEVSEVLGQDVGVPLARLDTGRLAARLEAIAAVESASVSRDWPTGLTVALVPRVAAAAVAAGEDYVLLDAGAAQVARVDQPPDGLPVIDVPLSEDNQRTVKAVLAVAAALPESLASQVATIGAQTEDTVAFTLASGVQVIWGAAGDSAVKAAAVEILLAQPLVTSIDVSAPTSPVVR
jgi:cell division protein FtsQ